MAERRMLSKKIVDSDAFLDLPLSTQSLYFHIIMRADDDGFVNNPKKIQRMIGASDDDLKLLLAKRFILAFESGVIVIKHWRMHNLLRKDRYNPTVYQEEMRQLELKENGAYTELATTWHPNGTQMAPQVRIGQDSIGKYKEKRFTKPTLDEVKAYCSERGNRIDAQRFIDYYESNGWKVGRNPMRDWKACVRSWETRNYEPKSKKENPSYIQNQSNEIDVDWSEVLDGLNSTKNH